jgi:cell division transport system permease protein
MTNLKRIIGFAFNDFSRNRGISVATIFVLSVAIIIISGLIFFQGVIGYLTNELQNRIDITAYFKADVSEEEILSAKDQILKSFQNAGIKSVEYVSKEKALEDFNQKHQDSEVLLGALKEVGDNPFLASLNIVTNGEPAQYQQVANILETSDLAKLINNVDYNEKKDTIEKVYSIKTKVNQVGIILSILLAIVAALVVYNTIKLAIDNSKDEISTMKVVGASDWFIRGPFIICGMIYGFIAFVICFFLFFLLSFVSSDYISVMMPGFSAFRYFLTNWWIFVLIQLGFGIGVGAFFSYMVVKRHLEV